MLEIKQRRNQLLLRLIYGMDCENESFREYMKTEGLFVNAEVYRVVLVTSVEKQEVDVSKITLYLDMMQKPEMEFRQVGFVDQKMVIFIIGVTLVEYRNQKE